MFIKVFGMKLRVECIVISMIIGAILGCHLLCGCATQEGMAEAGAALGDAVKVTNSAPGSHRCRKYRTPSQSHS